jgi:hypothetical protein
MRLYKVGVVVAGLVGLLAAGCGGTTPVAPKITTTSPLPSGIVGTAYSITLAATSGTPPYTWSISSGTLPAGLALSGNTISGTPTAAGSSSFTIEVTDSASTPQTGTLPATLVINPATLVITTTSPLTPGTALSAYSLTLAATGGTAPYTWSVSAGTLPAGLSLSAAGVLSGTPAALGSSSFTITATDSASTPQTATLAATLVINPAPLAITTTSPLTAGATGSPYSLTFAAVGGTAPYAWSISSGSLPSGLSLSSAGVLSGTPTAPGTSAFTVKVADSATAPQQTATLAASLTIAAGTLKITSAAPSSGTVNAAYEFNLTAAGGTPPYAWSVAAGSLPAGIALASNGILSGTPTAAGTYSFTAQATDSGATPQTATAPLTLSISIGTLAVSTTSLPTGNVGTAYVSQLAASGGLPPYTWSVGGAVPLPAGLTLSSSGLFGGTPTATGSVKPTFVVTDSLGNTAQSALTLAIKGATGTVPDGHYSFVFSGTSTLEETPATAIGVAINGTFAIQSGTILSGFYDENTNIYTAKTKLAIVGGSLTTDTSTGIGQLVLTTSGGTMVFSLATPASVTAGGTGPIRMIEFDDATGNGTRGSGVIDPAQPSPTAGAVSGNFAFLLSGTDIDQNQQALIGSFQTNGQQYSNGSYQIIGGKADANQFVSKREVESWSTLTGSYAIDQDGHGTLVIALGGTFNGSAAPSGFKFSFYEVSPTEWLIISLDPATLNSPLVSGIAYQQTVPSGGFTTASLPTTSVLEVSGALPATGSATAPVPDLSLGLVTSDGSGALEYTYDEYAGALTTGNSLAVAYTVDPPSGRTTTTASTGPTTQPILYIINSTSAFYLGVGASGQSGMIVAQTGAPFTNASFSGNYLGGSQPLVLTSVLNENGLVNADGAGNITFTTNRSGPTGLVDLQSVTGTYTVASDGRVVVTTPDGVSRIFYLISPTSAGYLTGDSGGYLGSFQQ